VVPPGVVAVSWLLSLYLQKERVSHPPQEARVWISRLVLVCLGLILFFLLPSHTPNADGVSLLQKIPQDVAEYGAHLTHDEMLELYVHSRMYFYMNQIAGWSVADCYRVTSALSGGVFLVLLFLLADRTVPREWHPMFLALALSGGYLQLFFGDIENYTMVATLIIAYLLAAVEHLKGRAGLWVPSLALATAAGFHLLAGWLLPSLLFLFWNAYRNGRRRECPWAAVAFALPLAGFLAFLHFRGLPIQRLADSSHVSGMGGHYERYLAPMSIEYLGGIANVVILLIPGIMLVPALILFGRMGTDSTARFLQVASLGMVAFTLLWRAQLGALQDWNLFAPGMAVIGVLIARGGAEVASLETRGTLARRALSALAWSAACHSAAWILRNHAAPRPG
jgi:hypothetical protein